MTNISDRPPPPSFYNSESQAIELVNGIEAAKTERRRARTTVTRGGPETEKTETDRNHSGLPESEPVGLSKADVKEFTEAAERRAGRTVYADWRTISRVYFKARGMAKKESGQNSIHHRKYQSAFSLLIKDLPPIAENDATCERYRTCLLKIEEADAKDGGFTKWYEKTQPRAVNPVALWNGFCDRDKKPSTKPKKNGSKHQQALAQAQQDAAKKITALMDRNAALSDQVRELGGKPAGEPSSEPTAEASYKEISALDALMARAWREEVALWPGSKLPVARIFDTLLSRLTYLALGRGIIGDGADDIDEVVNVAHDTIRNTYAEWSAEQQAETDEDEIDEDEDEDEDDDAA
jgi:hypothetical protein